ncbi:E3 ubiquitin-protein ligase [Caenorhabditis elegans]|uniref:E3 ubiquitin-protein ligase n=1 Tax=Caenorhabditis elegans TaxID=6239 RepID=V6CLC0_CAEEL|nr:E3 ubiquitin-protein ligase [Caenorhabditis elegans]CDK13343.1 E3 ubiquitin-protein ligase [Caenorhabditis elegans]|eukprot:NP_001293692.1 E3 ubiquitin-protein ligase hecd-1 [Caenorhabditis elegans]
MDGIDPETLLEWLQTGIGDERDLQLMALEQLCMLLLMADNIDRCFESCPPRTFIPALCKIFIDETAPDNVLEVTARAITYYLDVSNECTRRITQVDGAVKAICTRLAAADISDRSSKDLAEQCVKLLEHVCQRETMAVYDAGGINAMLTLVRVHGTQVHKDTMHSAMSVVTRLCGKMEPTDPELGKCAESLGALLEHEDPKVSESALRCFAALTDRFVRKMMDPAELAMHSNLVEHLISIMVASNDENSPTTASANILSIVLSLIGNLCRGSSLITEKVLTSPNMITGLKATLTNKEERVVTDGLRFCDLLLVLLCEGRSALPLTSVVSGDYAAGSGAERVHRQLIDAIRQKDLTALVDAIESGQVDVNFADDVGQSLTNWASAFGSIEMVQYLCDKGSDVNKGHKSSSLHYAACFGRPDVVKLLLQRGANPDLRDEDGKTALDKARERSDDDHNQVANILESPSAFMRNKEDPKVKASTSKQPGTSTKPELPNPNLVRKVLHQLLPIFCEIFQKSLNGSVRRTSLSLMRKIVENIGDLRQSAVGDGNAPAAQSARKMSTDVSAGAESLVAVVVSVMDQEDDHEGHEQVLLILESLLEKDAELWVIELVRLGVFERVEAMAKEPPKGLEEVLNAIHLEGRSRVTPMEIDFENQPSSSTAVPTANDIMDTTVPSSSGGADAESNSNPSTIEMADPESSTPSSSTQQSISKPKATASSTASSAILQVVSKLSSVASLDKSAAAVDKKPTKTVLSQGTPYRWKEWRIVRGTTSLFIWSDVLLIELPFQSNGWFRYLADNDSHVQFVTGTASVDQQMTEEEKDNFQKTERREMVSRWNAVKGVFDDDWSSVPIAVLGIPSNAKKLEVPAWELWSSKSSELQIKSISSSAPTGQANTMLTTIKIQDDAGGFLFETGTGRKTNVMPEHALPSDFHTGWSSHGVSTRKMKFRQDIQKRKVQELAWKLWNDHLKEAHAKPREALVRLENAARTIESTIRHVKAQSNFKHRNVKQPRIERVQEYCAAISTLHESIVDDRRLSTFEFSVSGIVPALFGLLSMMEKFPDSFPSRIFKEQFSKGEALSYLALKIVAVLEANEKFPQHLYDSPGGSSFGLQLLSRRVRTKLEMLPRADGKENNDENLVNKTGKIVKCEPLASVGAIRAYLHRMVTRQWHDRERANYRYVKEIQELKTKGKSIELRHVSDFDENGVIYWIGTNGRAAPLWTNPATVKAVKITCSDTRQPFGKPEDLLSRDQNPINCHTSDDKNAHFTIDLGLFVVPTSYSLRHSRGYGRSALRNWMLQGSVDAKRWENVIVHTDDKGLGEPGSTATWHVGEKGTTAFRFFRIAQNGKNSSGQTHYLSCSGFEIYGDIVDVVTEAICEDPPKKDSPAGTSSTPGSSSSAALPPLTKEQVLEMLPARENNNRLKSGLSLETVTSMLQRSRHRSRGSYKISESKSKVVRGKDWRWEDQDGGEGKFGRITSPPESGWVDVTWDNGNANSYRFGANGNFDIERVTSTGHRYSTPSLASHVPTSVMEAVRRNRAFYTPKTTGGPPSSSVFGTSSSAGSSRGAASALSRFASVKNTTPAGTPSSGGSSGGAIGKKSMSTTNLVDERQKTSGPSVASTGQAASAESLQHQTPSLENLLARAMPHAFGRIAENQEPEDEPMGGEESDSAASMRSAASSNSQMSMGSSSQQQQQQDSDMTPRDSAGTPSTPRDDKNQTLSVSAPDLAAARQRQASAETDGDADADETNSEDKTVGADDAMEEDDEEEETMEDEEDDDDDDDDESSNENQEKLVELLGGERGLFDKLKEVITGESLSDASSSAKDATTNEAQKKGGKKPKKWFKKMSSYTDVLKGLMQNRYPVALLDPAAAGIEMDEMMDDDDYYDFSEDGPDDGDSVEDEVAAHLGMPVDSFASMVAARTPITWRQFSELMSGSNRERAAMARAVASSRGSPWEDDATVKCTFEALIPAFDPRPGRSNVNQTLEVELPTVVKDFGSTKASSSKIDKDDQMRFFLRGPNMSGVDNVTIEMNDDSASLFRYMQIINNSVNWATKSDRSRRIWEPTYSICYCSADQTNVEVSKIPDEESSTPCQVNQCLETIGLLSRIQQAMPEAEITPNVFISDKLTLKVTQVLSDALVVAARSLPEWCSRLVYKYPCLFTVETRNMYMQATAFGVSRTIVWLQQRRDAAVERARGSAQAGNSSAARQHDRYHEYRVGRLRHERVKVTRAEETLLDQAIRLMKFHADRKAVLEIEYTNEEGTGLGPTLEFYALVAAELQRKSLALWVCDDDDTHASKSGEEREVDLGEGKKPIGYYVRRVGGLFPAPLPPGTDETKRAADMFRVLGVFLAKVLLDGRLVDLPLSRPFLKLLVHPQIGDDARGPNLHKILSLDDFEEVNPVKGSFLKELRALAQRKRLIENDTSIDSNSKRRKIAELKLHIKGSTCRVEDLALNFTVNPPSKVFQYAEMELVDGGSDIDVTIDNVEQYVEKCEEFYLNTGIAYQMRAFRDGFDRVFPLRTLRAYSPEEVQRLLSGEQCPEWSRDDILNYTEPKLGYTRESPGFLRFVDVMEALTAQERKNFLQFATGCSSLPPGGLANLHPRLTIVRKVESGDGSYPSVNTCVHYLKLPEYSSSAILRERLLTAINEKGFHLN